MKKHQVAHRADHLSTVMFMKLKTSFSDVYEN